MLFRSMVDGRWAMGDGRWAMGDAMYSFALGAVGGVLTLSANGDFFVCFVCTDLSVRMN